MTANDWILIALCVVGVVVGILGFLGGFLFKKIIQLGEKVSEFEARIKEGDRRFSELHETIGRLDAKIDTLTDLIRSLTARLPKRASDSNEWRREP